MSLANVLRLFVLFCCLPASPCFAQSFGNAGFLAPDTPGLESGAPTDRHSNNADILFLRQAARGNEAEIELSKAAQANASNDATRAFAGTMVDEHDPLNEKLAKSAKDSNVPIPGGLDPKHVAVREDLRGHVRDGEFDRIYLTHMVADHQEMLSLLIHEKGAGQNADLGRLASETLPTIVRHLESAKAALAALNETPLEASAGRRLR